MATKRKPGYQTMEQRAHTLLKGRDKLTIPYFAHALGCSYVAAENCMQRLRMKGIAVRMGDGWGIATEATWPPIGKPRKPKAKPPSCWLEAMWKPLNYSQDVSHVCFNNGGAVRPQEP